MPVPQPEVPATTTLRLAAAAAARSRTPARTMPTRRTKARRVLEGAERVMAGVSGPDGVLVLSVVNR